MGSRKRKTQPVNIHGLAQILSAIHEAGKLDDLAKQLDRIDKIATIRSDAFQKIIDVASSVPSIAKDRVLAATLSPPPISDQPDVIGFPRRDFPV